MSILNMLSPGIKVVEVDLTGIVPAASTSVGAYVGEFNWGPCDIPMLISDEQNLVSTFGIPTTDTTDSFVATSFFSCANFLSYTNSLLAVRTVNGNSAINAANSFNTITIKNEEVYENTYLYANNQFTYGAFVARYPGKMANGLKISVCANTNTFYNWEYKNYFDNAPGTSNYILQKRQGEQANTDLVLTANDEMHIIVVDTQGKFSGTANTILEKFSYLSKAKDAVDINGASAFYKNALFQSSRYIYALDPLDYANTNATWGKSSTEVSSYDSPPENYTITLSSGTDGITPSAANLINGWSNFLDKDKYEISLAFVGSSADLPSGVTVPQYVLDNVILGPNSETPTTGRRDTMLFVSPKRSHVVDQRGFEVDNITNNTLGFLGEFKRESSYAVMDSGWKYQYDRYNNVYRWVPLNADIAGLCAYTDVVADTWYSPAGFNRGKLKNVVKLAWSPNQTQRDALYKNGVNPVITMTGEGVVLLGDKTMQRKPSAFDRINVRRLFIILEKTISRAARYSLFEFNDEFTRAQFVALVEPYLRTVKSRRGIKDFRVICDESNNTPDIINRNGFVGSIYVIPNYSINFIELQFVALKTGVEFNTVIGQV